MIANIVSLSRLLGSPFIFYSISNSNVKMSIFLASYAIFSDFLDGYLARFSKKETSFGAILDVIADKSFLYAATFSLLFTSKKKVLLYIILSFWLVRDIFLLSLFLIKNPCFKSAISGKIYTFFQFLFIFCTIFLLHFNYSLYFVSVFIGVFFLLGVKSIQAYYVLFTQNK